MITKEQVLNILNRYVTTDSNLSKEKESLKYIPSSDFPEVASTILKQMESASWKTFKCIKAREEDGEKCDSQCAHCKEYYYSIDGK